MNAHKEAGLHDWTQGRIVEDCPPLAPEEHAWIESRVGRRLTNEEAQLALRDAKLTGAFNVWAEGRKP